MAITLDRAICSTVPFVARESFETFMPELVRDRCINRPMIASNRGGTLVTILGCLIWEFNLSSAGKGLIVSNQLEFLQLS